jgi:hypothetical protein
MVFLSIAICYCGEEREFGNLMCFLSEVIDPGKTEIVVLVDTSKVDPDFGDLRVKYPFVKFFARDFDGHFADHKNFLGEQCQGEYILNVDADEMPSEILLKNLETYKGPHDILVLPRINICPGYTQAFLDKWGFKLNDAGWINWPDWQGRFYKKGITWEGKVHEKLVGYKSGAQLESDPRIALLHIKDVKRQNSQNESYARLTELNS